MGSGPFQGASRLCFLASRRQTIPNMQASTPGEDLKGLGANKGSVDYQKFIQLLFATTTHDTVSTIGLMPNVKDYFYLDTDQMG